MRKMAKGYEDDKSRLTKKQSQAVTPGFQMEIMQIKLTRVASYDYQPTQQYLNQLPSMPLVTGSGFSPF
jgi:hypothetical protein